MPIEGHRADNKCPTITMKTFSALGLKPQGQEKKKEKKKEEEERKEEGQEEERFFCPRIQHQEG